MAPPGRGPLLLSIVAAGAAGTVLVRSLQQRPRNKEVLTSNDRSITGSPRLPTDVQPRKYVINLAPDLKACTFKGNVEMHIEVIAATRCIILNANDLTISETFLELVNLQGQSYQKVEPGEVLPHPLAETVALWFDKELSPGYARLHISFEGKLNNLMKGFYRSTYHIGREERIMAVTQFEPADARRAFPCWDEPAFKAKYEVSLLVPQNRLALSNMPAAQTLLEGPNKKVFFQESPLMSTYLVAFLVGELDYVEGSTSDGVTVRVYTEPGKKAQGNFALDCAIRTLPFFASYFGHKYPLPKLDMVAVPDFAAGAMENYGLVTYRAASLLVDPNESSASTKQRVAITVTHELAHQWFGNLVTMDWWTHLWLNEGFASWVSYLATDFLFPEWHIWTQFAAEETALAFQLDGLQESHPIEVEIEHADEIDEIFDDISYSKGATVIRMLQAYLGPEHFQKGLSAYIAKFEFRNAATEDLWASLEAETGVPVRAMMNTWTKQTGYPVLKASLRGDTLHVEQERYLSQGIPGPGEWVVPVTLARGHMDNTRGDLLKGKRGGVPLPPPYPTGKPGVDWVKVNPSQTGFYRVQYDSELESRLIAAIKEGHLGAADRLGVLDDTFALCRAGKQPLGVLLSLLEAYRGEEDFTVITSLYEVTLAVSRVIADSQPSAAMDFKSFACSLFRDQARALGWHPKEGEGHLAALTRSEVHLALVTFEDQETIKEAKQLFDSAVAHGKGFPSSLAADPRKVAYMAVMSGVTAAEPEGYSALMKVYEQSEMSEERMRVLSCLAAGHDPQMVRQALDFSSTAKVRNQDALYVLSGVRSECREEAWSWLQDHWDEIFARHGEGFLITRFITYTLRPFASLEKAEELKRFFEKRSNVQIARTVRQAIERVQTSARWVEELKGDNRILSQIKSLVAAVPPSS